MLGPRPHTRKGSNLDAALHWCRRSLRDVVLLGPRKAALGGPPFAWPWLGVALVTRPWTVHNASALPKSGHTEPLRTVSGVDPFGTCTQRAWIADSGLRTTEAWRSEARPPPLGQGSRDQVPVALLPWTDWPFHAPARGSGLTVMNKEHGFMRPKLRSVEQQPPSIAEGGC